MFNKSFKDDKEVKRGFALKCIMEGGENEWVIKTQDITFIELIGALSLILNKEMEKINVKRNEGMANQ